MNFRSGKVSSIPWGVMWIGRAFIWRCLLTSVKAPHLKDLVVYAFQGCCRVRQRLVFRPADANRSRIDFAVVRPAVWRAKSTCKEFGQRRTSAEVVLRVHRVHVDNLRRTFQFDED